LTVKKSPVESRTKQGTSLISEKAIEEKHLFTKRKITEVAGKVELLFLKNEAFL